MAKTGFGQRLAQYGKWRDKVNLDRFVTLAFLTAAEKRAFCEKFFGDPDVDYLDGEDVATITLKPESEQRSVPAEEFTVKGTVPEDGNGNG